MTRNETYAASPVSHRVANVGDGEFRLIGVLNRGEGAPPDAGSGFGPFPAADWSGHWFQAATRPLDPGEVVHWDRHSRDIVLVQAGEGPVQVDGGVGPEVLDRPGSFTILRANQSYRLHSRGASPTALAFIEVR